MPLAGRTAQLGQSVLAAAMLMLTVSTPADAYSTPRIVPSRDGTHATLYSCAAPLPPSTLGPLSVRCAPRPWSSTEIKKMSRFSRRKVQVALSNGDRNDIRSSSFAHAIFEVALDVYGSASEKHKLQLLSRLLSQANEESKRSEILQKFQPQKKRK